MSFGGRAAKGTYTFPPEPHPCRGRGGNIRREKKGGTKKERREGRRELRYRQGISAPIEVFKS